jgi:uncharacterized protein YggE
VKLRDLDKAGEIIDSFSALAGDFLQIQGVGYSLDDTTAVLAAARADAVTRAAAQAKQLADAAGVRLGGLRSITEVPQPGYPTALAGSAAAGGTASQVALAPGSQELTLQVTMIYDIAR